MPNTELPIDIEQQIILMKKYVNFSQKKKMREFLGYAGYFRASRYGKYLLTQVNNLGSKADAKVYFDLYDFDLQLRLLLFKYCKKAEVHFKSAIANAVSLKTGDAGFYLDAQYYTSTKSEKDKKTKNRNVQFFNNKFFPGIKDTEKILSEKDGIALSKELDRLIRKAKIDVYKMNILPADWKELYDRVLPL